MKPRLLDTMLPVWWSNFWDWVQTVDFLAQSAHVFSAWAITLTASMWMMPWKAAVGFLAYTSAKELVFDRVSWGEGHGTSDWLDWFVNVGGIGVALVVLWLKGELA